MRAWSAHEFVTLDLPRPSWVVPGLIPGGGWSLIIAPAKTGKSIFCAQLAKGLSRGEPIIYWRPERPWRVSFVGWDAPDVDYQVQLRAIDPEPHENFQVVLADDPPKMLLDDVEEGKRVFEVLHRQHQTEFIIFDALESMTARDINTKEGAQGAVRTLKALAGGKPFLLIHHPRKERTGDDGPIVEDPRNAAAGHHYLTTNSSTTLALRANEKEGTLKLVGRRGRSGDYELARHQIHPEVAIWVPSAKKAPAGGSGRAIPTGASLRDVLQD